MKKIFKNEVFSSLDNYIRANSGTDGLFKTQLGEDYKKAMEDMRQFNGKKVQIKFTCEMDFITGKGYKVGKIKVEDGKLRFYEGRKTTRFYYLDAGIFNGFYATLIPLEIEEVNSTTIIHKN